MKINYFNQYILVILRRKMSTNIFAIMGFFENLLMIEQYYLLEQYYFSFGLTSVLLSLDWDWNENKISSDYYIYVVNPEWREAPFQA